MTTVDSRALTARKKFGNGIPPVYRIGLSWTERHVAEFPHSLYSVLDYGCGFARFADEFIKRGAHYIASDLVRQDFSAQPLFEERMSDYSDMADFIPADRLHLCEGYKLVMLSNVVNVQETQEQLESLIKEAWRLIDPGGDVLLNYPKNPRRLALSHKELCDLIYKTLERKCCLFEFVMHESKVYDNVIRLHKMKEEVKHG